MTASYRPRNISLNNSTNSKSILIIRPDFEKARQTYLNKSKIIEIGSVEQKLLRVEVLGGYDDGTRVLFKLQRTI